MRAAAELEEEARLQIAFASLRDEELERPAKS